MSFLAMETSYAKSCPSDLLLLCQMGLNLLRLFLSFFVIFLLLHLLCATTSAATGKNNETDFQALLEFKAKISDESDDPFGVLSSWNRSIHFCQWPGVSCGGRHQRVTQLDLQSSKLVGTISPHIGNLSFLRFLNLQNNSFSRQIPEEIGRLSRLRSLYLNNNTLSGRIPANLSSCSNLVAFNLGFNQIVGNIPHELGSLSNLRILYLYKNELTGSIPPSLGNLSNLEQFSAAFNNLTGIIPHSIGQLLNLNFLYFGSNSLSGPVPVSIFNLSSLIQIGLEVNQLQGDLSSVPFQSLPNVTVFSAGTNMFTGSIPESISNMSKIIIFQLQKNRLTGNVPSLGNLRNLRIFAINNNNLGTGQANDLEFLTSLINASMLDRVQLGFNEFGGVLPEQIGNLSTSLQWLNLGPNQICGSIPSGIGDLINLQVLDARGNQFSGMIPLTIGRLQNLVLLYMDNNSFSGNIPQSLGNLTSLIELGLSGNALRDRIPSSLGKCQNLLGLDLSRNNLSYDIPPEVFGIPSLSIGMNLSNNHLTGIIPLEIGNAKNLGVLDLSRNMLSGDIPSSLGSCIRLETINLGSNFLEGSIPSSLSSLRGLEVLDLSHNNLSGEITAFLSNLAVLKYLDLSFNNLEGMVPVDGVFKKVNATSVEGNSKLCGGLPEFMLPKCSSEMPKKKGLGLTLRLVIGVGSGLVGVALILSILFLFWLQQKRKGPKLNYPANELPGLSYHSLYLASNGFSPANVIGMGSFGTVYKGRLDGEETLVAIKVLHLVHQGALKSFIAECEMLKNIRHRNLVKVLTVCSSIDFQGSDFKALVYEFMVNGSLEEWLHQAPDDKDELVDAPRKLSLLQRLNIAIDVACALDYLHHESEKTSIVHCDIKPSNILLDEEMTAHVGDFGLAKFLVEVPNDSRSNPSSSVGVRGTIGYAPPEYGMGNEVSTSGDVYSYGILLLEMFTGKRPADGMFEEGFNLHSFVRSVSSERVAEILDPALLRETESWEIGSSSYGKSQRSILEERLGSIFRIGVACSVELAGERMSMNNVATQLVSVREELMKFHVRN